MKFAELSFINHDEKDTEPIAPFSGKVQCV